MAGRRARAPAGQSAIAAPPKHDQPAEPDPAHQRRDDEAERRGRRVVGVGAGQPAQRLGEERAAVGLRQLASRRRTPCRPRSIRGRRRPMSGPTAVQRSRRSPARSADLARRLALEEARDRAEVRRRAGEEGLVRVEHLRRAVAAPDPEPRAEVDPLQPPVRRRDEPRRRPLVRDRVVADAVGLPRPQLDEVLRLERRRRRDADEQHRDPDVHDVAAVASPVAPHERDQRRRHRVARHRAPRAHPAPQLLPDRAEHERREREHQQRRHRAGDAGRDERGASPATAAPTGSAKLRCRLATVARRHAISGPIPDSSTRISASGVM